jgi:RND family efflux transporter MFP subunit
MKHLQRHPLLTAATVVVLVLVAWIVLKVVNGEAKGGVRKERVITVGTMMPVRKDLQVRLTYTADIQPFQQVNIFSRVDGYISKIHVDKGDLVKANQVLVEIDHTDYQLAVNRAKANLSAARSDVSRQNAMIRNAKLTLERTGTLLKQEFISQQDLDNAQANYDMAVAQLDSLRAQVSQLEVALQQAEANLAYSYIRAPFAGYVSVRNLDPGAFVSGSTASTSTMSRGILVLQDITTLRVLLDVVEKDVPLVKIGQRAELRVEAYPDRLFTGSLTRIVHALDRNTRTMTVEVDLANSDRTLKGGMFARVELVVGEHRDALQIPIDAVTRLETDQYVYIVKDGKARKMPVEIGVRENRMVEVTKGLQEADPVIVSGKDLVSDGAAIDPRPMDTPAAPPGQKS